MIMDDWVYPSHELYQAYMIDLMEFFHGCVDYPSDKKFTREELLELEPIDIKRWMAHKAYGDPDYKLVDGEHPPIYIRSSTAEFAKKSISFFMPLRDSPWIDGSGNPTKSKMVNEFVKEIKALETRREIQTVRSITEPEFRRTIQIFRAQSDRRTKCKFTTMAILQYHLIARMDDIAHMEMEHLKSHANFDFAMQAKVRRSRHAATEQQQQQQASHDQILLGSIDPLSCIITNLGLYLESFLGVFPQSKYLFTTSPNALAPKQVTQAYRSRLEGIVLHNTNFRAVSNGDPRSVGVDSYRKFPSQYAMGKGASQEDVDIRGRWKKQGGRRLGAANPITDPSHLCMDAKVASLLCLGGPIKYKLRPDIVISDDWLLENIVPNIHQRYPEDTPLCKMFALAILCTAMDHGSTTGIPVPQELREKVRQAYAGLGFDQTHPVMKVPIKVYNMGQQLMIDEAVPVSATAPMQGSIPIQAILMRIDRLERNATDYHRQQQESIQRMQQVLATHLSTINSSICRLGGAVLDALARGPELNRAVAQGRATGNPRFSQQYIQCQDLPALLSKNPRTLIDLWNEYKYGINGGKPAEQFNTQERNSRTDGLKQKYYRRRIVWECMERLVRRGDSPQVAANKIHDIYGHDLSVTQLINLMIRDRQTGGHPNLR